MLLLIRMADGKLKVKAILALLHEPQHRKMQSELHEILHATKARNLLSAAPMDELGIRTPMETIRFLREAKFRLIGGPLRS
jgi:hypothetical protein